MFRDSVLGRFLAFLILLISGHKSAVSAANNDGTMGDPRIFRLSIFVVWLVAVGGFVAMLRFFPGVLTVIFGAPIFLMILWVVENQLVENRKLFFEANTEDWLSNAESSTTEEGRNQYVARVVAAFHNSPLRRLAARRDAEIARGVPGPERTPMYWTILPWEQRPRNELGANVYDPLREIETRTRNNVERMKAGLSPSSPLTTALELQKIDRERLLGDQLFHVSHRFIVTIHSIVGQLAKLSPIAFLGAFAWHLALGLLVFVLFLYAIRWFGTTKFN